MEPFAPDPDEKVTVPSKLLPGHGHSLVGDPRPIQGYAALPDRPFRLSTAFEGSAGREHVQQSRGQVHFHVGKGDLLPKGRIGLLGGVREVGLRIEE